MKVELERLCANCQASHPSEPVFSEYMICLKDPDFEPYLDDIIDRQDFSRCAHLIESKKFDSGQEVCSEFDPVADY